MVRIRLNERYELTYDKEAKQSTLLSQEVVYGLLEYAPNKLVVTTHPNKLIIIDNWT